MNFLIIIPALERNKYSKKGDLVNWGSSTLLEWKIAQAKKVKGCKQIYVVSNGKKIEKICKDQNINFLKRKNNLKKIESLHLFVANKFKNFDLIWLNPTYPFIKPRVIDEFIKIYKIKKKKYSSITGSYILKEYMFLNNKSINYNSKDPSISRNLIKPVNQIINAISIIKGNDIIRYKNLLGKKTYFRSVDWLSTLEIKTSKDINLFKSLIDYYFI